MTRGEGIDDFTFLNHDSFLLVSPPGQFEVFNFSLSRVRATNPTLRFTYLLPPLSDGYLYWYISMSSNPAPGYVPQRSGYSNNPKSTDRQQVHYPHPNERIHSCCIYIFNPLREDRNHVQSFVFFLNLKMLMDPPAHWFANPPRPPTNDPLPIWFCPASDFITGTSATQNQSRWVLNGPFPQPIQMNVQSTSSGDSRTPSYPPFPSFDSPVLTHHSAFSGYSVVDAKPQLQAPMTDIPWEVWGTDTTRWFEECISTDWQHAVYGLRAADSVNPETVIADYNMPPPPPPSSPPPGVDTNQDNVIGPGVPGATPNPKFLRIRNFNPYSFSDVASPSPQPREGKGKDKISWRKPRLVTEPSTTPVSGVFKHDIVSSLPYTEIVSEEMFEVTDVMMDDCRVLLLKVCVCFLFS